MGGNWPEAERIKALQKAADVVPDADDDGREYDEVLEAGGMAALRKMVWMLENGTTGDQFRAADAILKRWKGMPMQAVQTTVEEKVVRVDVTHRVLREMPTERLEAILRGDGEPMGVIDVVEEQV